MQQAGFGPKYWEIVFIFPFKIGMTYYGFKEPFKINQGAK